MNLQALLTVTKGKASVVNHNLIIEEIFIDSRKPIISKNSLFIAIKGKNNNGHNHLKELYEAGIRNFLVEEPIKSKEFQDSNLIEVSNSIEALQKIAAWKREKCHSFLDGVIGITGSNGKTIVKEWLALCLEKKFRVLKNPGSYNSQVGVPLSVWKLNENYNFGVFEAGISTTGEMQHLEQIIQPSIGIFTNLGSAHDEGFNDRVEKVREKCQLFKNCEVLIYPYDSNEIKGVVNQTDFNRKINLLSWSLTDVTANIFITESDGKWKFQYENLVVYLTIPFNESMLIENCITCICTLLYLGFSEEEIQSRISILQPVDMRLKLKKAKNNCYIIDDTYNNDLAALELGLDFLIAQKQKKIHTLVLSDLLQTNLPEEELHKKISSMLSSKGIHRMVGVGEALYRNRGLFSIKCKFYKTTETLIRSNVLEEFNNEILLIKGARTFQFERIVKLLEEKTHDTELIINLNSVAHNLNFFKKKLEDNTKLMVMVKAFAYGSGSLEIANLLQYHKVDYLAVAYTDEGIFLRQNGIHLPIMVMNPQHDNLEDMVRFKLEPQVYNFRILHKVFSELELINSDINIHLKLDTGMNRLGFKKEDIPQLIKKLQANSKIKVKSILTHLAASDNEGENEFSKSQISTFESISVQIQTQLSINPIKHVLNTSGISQFPEHQFDMVRLGIGLYGIESTGKSQKELEFIGTLKTRIAQIKTVKRGETVGYSRMGKVDEEKRIAVVNIGYADGYDRRFSNGVGHMEVNGKLAPVIGNVCMDMTMLDITSIEAKEGEEVIVFGTKPNILEQAKAIGTIPYELLTNVGQRVKRVFVSE